MTEIIDKKSKILHIPEADFFNLIKEAYRHGYAQYEIVEAGLESFDPEGYADWCIHKLILDYN